MGLPITWLIEFVNGRLSGVVDARKNRMSATRWGQWKRTDLKSGHYDKISAVVMCALPEGSVEFMNNSWRENTGSSLEELTGWGWKNSIHAEGVAKFTAE